MLLVCDDHVELAIDIIVDEYEKAPEVLTLAQAGLDVAAPRNASAAKLRPSMR